jgi:putative heme-binding domain-containing protein
MGRRTRTALGLVCFVMGAALGGAHAQNLPGGTGKAEFERICSGCHSLDRATSQRLTRPEWAGVVNDMVGKGAQGNSAELENVVSYLSDHFGKSAAAPAPRTSAPARGNPAAPAAPTVAPDAREVAKAQGILEAKGCLECHRVGGKGSYVGPSLEDAGAHRSMEQLRAALLSPAKNLAPENRVVHLVTAEGRTLTGRLLNQDGFSVQFIDARGELMSVDRLRLRSFSIEITNPMPSYENTLRAEDLDVVVRYLSSLKGGVTP